MLSQRCRPPGCTCMSPFCVSGGATPSRRRMYAAFLEFQQVCTSAQPAQGRPPGSELNVTPHVAQRQRWSAIDGRTIRHGHPGQRERIWCCDATGEHQLHLTFYRNVCFEQIVLSDEGEVARGRVRDRRDADDGQGFFPGGLFDPCRQQSTETPGLPRRCSGTGATSPERSAIPVE